MHVTARISVGVALATAMSVTTGCAAHAAPPMSASARPNARANAETTSAVLAMTPRAEAKADDATSRGTPDATTDDDDAFDAMPLYKPPTTWRELVELMAAHVDDANASAGASTQAH